MCFAYGSIDQAISVCPMCKVFKPSASRCPHHQDICRNRTLHPRHDVVYLKNAEVQSFNGCGFCKWARTNPSPKQSGYSNPGWPGCCRSPSANEQRMIQAADWPAVSMIHHVPIPAEIKTLLDSLPTRGGPFPTLNVVPARSSGGSPSVPTLDRKNSGNASPKSNSPSAKSSPMMVPVSKGRPGGSPQQLPISLTSASLKGSGIPTSLPTASAMDRYRQVGSAGKSDERIDTTHSSNSSPIRKQIELDGSISRRSSNRRPSVSGPVPGTSVSKAMDAHTTPPAPRHRASTSTNVVPPKTSPPRPSDRQPPVLAVRTQTRRSNEEISTPISAISSASSSSGSSDSMGSLTDGTVTTDGGFTDYLSEESEEELQRQAEAKAILVAQNQAEENEFKAARQRLENVDLRPPKSWNPGRNSSQSPPRALQTSSAHPTTYSSGTPYPAPSYVSSAVAHTGST